MRHNEEDHVAVKANHPRAITVVQRLMAGFLAVILVIVGLGVFGARSLSRIKTDADLLVQDCLPGSLAISQISARVKENKALLNHHLLSEADAIKAKIGITIDTNLVATKLSYDVFMQTVSLEEGRKLVHTLEASRAAYDKVFDDVYALSSKGSNQAAMELVIGNLNPGYDNYVAALDAQMAFSQKSGKEASQKILSSVSNTHLGGVAGIVLALVVAVVVAFVISRRVNGLLGAMALNFESVASSLNESAGGLASSSRTIAQATASQADALRTTAVSIEEISNMSNSTTGHVQETTKLAGQTREAAEAGLGQLSDVNSTLRVTCTSVEAMNERMQDIQRSADEVSRIVKTIDEIAFQTSILSLNASVEAARAGEFGAGFAVVANEIRSLANSSANAAQETAAKIEASRSASKQGLKASEDVSMSLKQLTGKAAELGKGFEIILARARTVDETTQRIAMASREQSEGIRQVNASVTNMDSLNQDNAEKAKFAATIASSLTEEAGRLSETVSELFLLVGRQKNEPERADGFVDQPSPKQSSDRQVSTRAQAKSPITSRRSEAVLQEKA